MPKNIITPFIKNVRDDDDVDEPLKSYNTLSREQARKALFLQLASQKNLPKDIIICIYIELHKSEQEDINKTIKYHTINIEENCLTYSGTVPSPLEKIIHIKFNNRFVPCCGRIIINKLIKIIGIDDYLKHDIIKETINESGGCRRYWAQASMKRKLLYLQTTPVDEILADYDDYLNQELYHLYIDAYGEASFVGIDWYIEE